MDATSEGLESRLNAVPFVNKHVASDDKPDFKALFTSDVTAKPYRDARVRMVMNNLPLFFKDVQHRIPPPQKIKDKTSEILLQDNAVAAFFEHDSCPLQRTPDRGKTKTFAQIKESWEMCSGLQSFSGVLRTW